MESVKALSKEELWQTSDFITCFAVKMIEIKRTMLKNERFEDLDKVRSLLLSIVPSDNAKFMLGVWWDNF